VVVVLLFFFVVVTVEGQACVPYHGSPATGGKCDSVVTYPNVLLLPTKPYAKVPSRSRCMQQLWFTRSVYVLSRQIAVWLEGLSLSLFASPAQVDEEAASTTKLLGAFVPQACRSAAIRLACMGSFIECSFTGTAFVCTCRDHL
jgi:hypothetical protein